MKRAATEKTGSNLPSKWLKFYEEVDDMKIELINLLLSYIKDKKIINVKTGEEIKRKARLAIESNPRKLVGLLIGNSVLYNHVVYNVTEKADISMEDWGKLHDFVEMFYHECEY